LQLLVSLLILALSAATQGLVVPPLSMVWIHPICFAPALWVLSAARGRRAFLLGWFWGFLMELVVFYWLVFTARTFSNLPTPLAAMVLVLFGLAYGAYGGFFAWGLARIRRASGAWWTVAVAAWFTACEFLNPQLFPYTQGVLWYRQPWVFLAVSLVGQAGLSFLVLLANTVVLAGLEHWRARRRGAARTFIDPALVRGLSVLAVALLSSMAWSLLRLHVVDGAQSSAPTVRIALIQTGTTVKRARAMTDVEMVTDQVELTRQVLEKVGHVDAIVWPEGAISGSPQAQENAPLGRLVEETGAEVWTGANVSSHTRDGDKARMNSAFRVYGDGQLDRRYDKNILLPFGEYMPLEKVFPFLRLIRGVGKLTPGNELVAFDSPKARFVFLICYEAIHSGYVRKAIRDRVNLLVNVSYDGWFGTTSCPWQHLMLSAAQSAQYGVPMARGATTGVSAFVDAAGRVTDQTETFERTFLVKDVPIVRVFSPYALVGDVFAWGCVVFSALLLFSDWRGRRSRAAP
jgi:apolipoprotein N-acyltransferase